MSKRAEKLYHRLLCLTVIVSLAAALLQTENGRLREDVTREQTVCWWCLLEPSFGLSDLLRQVSEEGESLEEKPSDLLGILRQPGKIRFRFRFWKG